MVYDYPFAQRTPVDASPALALLRQADPIAQVKTPWGGLAYLVTRYEAAKKILLDPAMSLAQVSTAGGERSSDPSVSCVPNLDPPGHTVMRRLIAPAITPRRMHRARPMIKSSTSRLLDQVAEAPVDLVRAVCEPLSLAVVCRLIGIPEQDWSIVSKFSRSIAGGEGVPGGRWHNAWSKMAEYLSQLAEVRRCSPEDDILSDLVVLFDGQNELPQSDMFAIIVQMIVDGHVITLNQLRILLFALIRDSEFYRRLVDAPESIPVAVDELLRLHPYSEPIFRVATQSIVIDGFVIPAGSLVLIDKFAVNMDPEVFPNPNVVRLDRAHGKHITFGHGRHRCVGATLARLELETVVEELVSRYPKLRFVSAAGVEEEWDGTQSGIERLQVTW